MPTAFESAQLARADSQEHSCINSEIPTRIFRAALAATLLITGCRGSDRQDQNAGTLTVLYPVDERSWAFFVPAQFLVFLPLTERGRDGKMHGWLARSWEHSADWRSWTVRLRSDARWHDGRQVTADDAKFSLELLANPDVGAEAPNAYSVRVLDDTTFVVTFRQQPSEYWMYYDPVYRSTCWRSSIPTSTTSGIFGQIRSGTDRTATFATCRRR